MIDLCDTTGIDGEVVAQLLAIPHVRVVAVAGTVGLGAIMTRCRGSSKLVFMSKHAFFDCDQRDACFDLHNRFYAFQFAVKTLTMLGHAIDNSISIT